MREEKGRRSEKKVEEERRVDERRGEEVPISTYIQLEYVKFLNLASFGRSSFVSPSFSVYRGRAMKV